MSMRSLMSVHRVHKKLRTNTRGAAGGAIATISTVQANMACRIVPMSLRESAKFQIEGVDADHRVYFADDPKLTVENFLVPSTNTSRALKVMAVHEPDELGRYWIAICKEQNAVDGT